MSTTNKPHTISPSSSKGRFPSHPLLINYDFFPFNKTLHRSYKYFHSIKFFSHSTRINHKKFFTLLQKIKYLRKSQFSFPFQIRHPHRLASQLKLLNKCITYSKNLFYFLLSKEKPFKKMTETLKRVLGKNINHISDIYPLDTFSLKCLRLKKKLYSLKVSHSGKEASTSLVKGLATLKSLKNLTIDSTRFGDNFLRDLEKETCQMKCLDQVTIDLDWRDNKCEELFDQNQMKIARNVRIKILGGITNGLVFFKLLSRVQNLREVYVINIIEDRKGFVWKNILTQNRDDLIKMGIPFELLDLTRVKSNSVCIEKADFCLQFSVNRFYFWRKSL